MDIRENYSAHDIRILGIDEGGSVDFAVYGYMNRGVHEGQVGVSVCHFDSVAATVEEVLFIKSDKSYGRLKTDMGGVLCESTEGNLYCMMEGSVYCVNTLDQSVRILAEELGSKSYCVSPDHQLLVWQQDFANGGDLTVADLEKEHMSVIEAGSGEKLYPIGFLEDDFVYGVAENTNPPTADGKVPMSRIVIYNVTSGEKVKEYSKPDYYILDVSIDEYVITLQRVKRTDTGYVEADSDAILNHEGEGILDDNICKSYDSVKQMQVQILLAEKAVHKTGSVVTSREVLLEDLPERTFCILLRDEGACISPFAAWLLLQGTETLSLRLERHAENTKKVVDFLCGHPMVEKVNHPSLPDHPDHALYEKYFPNGGASIFTIQIKGGREEAFRFVDNLKVFSLLANVADVKSLVIHPASTTHAQLTDEELANVGIYQNTIRLSIGTEHIDDILEDLDQALNSLK